MGAVGGAGRTAMRTRALVITTLFVAFQSGTGIAVSHAADLTWEVENPYRFFAPTTCCATSTNSSTSVRWRRISGTI